LLLSVGAELHSQEGRREDEILSKATSGYTLNGATHLALSETFRLAEVPGGIAVLGSCQVYPEFSFRVKPDSSLEKALREIVLTDRSFHWLVDDGVVYAGPVGGTPKLLETEIVEYSYREGEPLEAAVDRLLQKREVVSRANQLALTRGVARLGMQSMSRRSSDGGPPEQFPTIKLSHVKLYQALNALVRKHGSGIWLYREDECRGVKTFTVDVVAQ
jgi:hypothetical protein